MRRVTAPGSLGTRGSFPGLPHPPAPHTPEPPMSGHFFSERSPGTLQTPSVPTRPSPFPAASLHLPTSLSSVGMLWGPQVSPALWRGPFAGMLGTFFGGQVLPVPLIGVSQAWVEATALLSPAGQLEWGGKSLMGFVQPLEGFPGQSEQSRVVWAKKLDQLLVSEPCSAPPELSP